MPIVVRNGDMNASGGMAIGGAKTVTAEGIPIMFPGQPVTPHPPCNSPGNPHCSAVTTGGSKTVTAEGIPVITTADIDSCGDMRVTGAATVMAGV